MSPAMRKIIGEITERLDALEDEYQATAPEHLPRSGGAVREYGRMINSRIRECRELYDWSVMVRERIGGLVNLRSLGSRYGVSYETVRRYVDHSIGMRPGRWASTRGAGRPRA